MRNSSRPFLLSLAGFLLAAAPHARAVDEIGEPAGELPEDEALPDVAPTEGEGEMDADAMMLAEEPAPQALPRAPKGKTKGSRAKEAPREEEKVQEAWDSYSDVGVGGSAQDITKGVRVEDIVEPPSDYRYAAFGKADPFVPPMITSDKPAGPGNLEIPIVSPLQRVELSRLKLVGIWQLASGERKAMIMAPTDDTGSGVGGEIGVIVKNGDPIGQRGGKILGIGDDFLTVREFSLAADGTRQYEDQQMYMGTRSADSQPGKIVFTPGERQPRVEINGGTPEDPANLEKADAPEAAGGAAPAPQPGKAGVGNGDLGGAAQATPAPAAQGGPLPQPNQPAKSVSAYTPPAAPAVQPAVVQPAAAPAQPVQAKF